jgi:hypothetical protein
MGWGAIRSDDFSFARVLLLMIFDFFLYAVLAWYLEIVLPNEVILFLFHPSHQIDQLNIVSVSSVIKFIVIAWLQSSTMVLLSTYILVWR